MTIGRIIKKNILFIFILLVASACGREKSNYTILLGHSSSIRNPLTSALLIQARYANASNWSQYVQRSDYSTACTGAETGIGSCVHGGDKKKVVLSGITSCTDLSMTDNLGAFFWYCDSSSGTATFYSSLKLDKTLGDLVDSTPDWRFNKITLTGPGYSASTVDEKWWTNVVVEAPNNPTSCTLGVYHGCSTVVALLNSANVVYVMTTTRESSGYSITAHNVSFATLPSVRILSRYNSAWNCSHNGGTDNAFCSIDTEGVNFAWVEFKSQYSGGGVDPRASTWMFFPLHVQNTKHSIFRHIKIATSASAPVLINSSSHNIFSNIYGSNNRDGFYVEDHANSSLTTNNIFRLNLVANSLNSGFEIDRSPGNYFLANTSMGTDRNFLAKNDSHNSTVHNFLGVGTTRENVRIENMTGNNLSQLTLFNSTTNALSMINTTLSKITGNLIFGNNTANCASVSGATPLNSLCAVIDGVSNPNIITGITAPAISASFVGQLTSDAINVEENGAGQMLNSNYGGDWLSFENIFRSWSHATFLTPGRCGVSCQLQDNTLALASTVIRNTTDSGNSSNGANLVGGSACPAAAGGNKILTHVNTNFYMKNAIEIDGDGDGDGLCESNETCLYTPNFGAYQGHGTFGQCTFSDGTIFGVKMFGYETNGR